MSVRTVRVSSTGRSFFCLRTTLAPGDAPPVRATPSKTRRKRAVHRRTPNTGANTPGAGAERLTAAHSA